MPVDYAEPTKLQDFKVEVFQPQSNTPTLTKQPNSSTYDVAPGQLTVPNRDTSLGKPNNLPSRQESLRNDGQYRTIDVTPNTTAKPAPKTLSDQLGARPIQYQTQFGETNGAQAIALGLYYAGFYTYGLFGGESVLGNYKPTPTEETADEVRKLGNQTRQITDEAVKSSEKLLDDLWRNKPTFEIPQIKIPKFDKPELPDLDIPKFPDFKFPEISFPKPQPVDIPTPKLPKPKPSLIEQLKRIDMIDCGGASMKIVYVALYCGEATIRNAQGEVVRYDPIYQQANLDAFLKAYISEDPSLANSSVEQILEGGGQTGFNSSVDNGKTLKFKSYPFQVIGANIDGIRRYSIGNYVKYILPYYQAQTITIDLKPGSSVKDVLEYCSDETITTEVYYFQSKFPNKPGCSLPSHDPPPPPPEDDCCRMGCCPKPTEIDYRLIKKIVDQTLKEQKFTIEVPICKCEYDTKTNKWLPKTDNVIMEVFATSQLQAYQLAQLHLENARQAADLCVQRNKEEPIAAIPQAWQIRHEGDKPQLVIHCAEKKEDGTYDSAKYPITVPHWKGTVHDKPSLPAYKKGNWEGILVLADNSKVTINAASEAECTKILNSIKPWIDKNMLKNSYFKGGKINLEIKNTQVKPMYGRYFATGQKNSKPDWRVDFP